MTRRELLAGLALLLAWPRGARADEGRRLARALCGEDVPIADPPPLPAVLDDAALERLRHEHPQRMQRVEEQLRVALYASRRHGGLERWARYP